MKRALWVVGLIACAHRGSPDPPATPVPIVAPAPHCPEARATQTVRVKVMSINLRHDNDEWKRRFELVADEIARLDPDLIGTQELEVSREQGAIINQLLIKRGHPAYFVFAERKSGLGGFLSGEGIGILSRWPIATKASEDIGEERVAVFARVDHPAGGFIDLYDTHLDQHAGPDGDASRAREAEKTIAFMNRHDDCRPTLLTGDMNSVESGPAITRFRVAGFEDSFRVVHGEETPRLGNTGMVKLEEGAFKQHPRRRIDFILGRAAGERAVKPTESIVCFQNHDAKGFYPSDHFGVMTTFEIGL